MSGAALVAWAPGRVNLIGEHTDYNDGLCLPFAIERGVTVAAQPLDRPRVEVEALDEGEEDAFALDAIEPAGGWRAYVRGVTAELRGDGHRLRGARLAIRGDVPRGGGLSSSAALEVAVALALLAVAGVRDPDPVALARACSRAENEWAGARTGLLDQLAVLLGRAGAALRLDLRDLSTRHVPLELGDWRLVVADSGAAHDNAAGGYNARRDECAEAARALAVRSLRDATEDDVRRLGDPLDRRVRHVVTENARVDAAVRALEARDLEALGDLLDASHASLRDDYDASVPAVERAVARLREQGARGARMVGGGFGGSVLALLPPGVAVPDGAFAVRPGGGARVESARRAR